MLVQICILNMSINTSYIPSLLWVIPHRSVGEERYIIRRYKEETDWWMCSQVITVFNYFIPIQSFDLVEFKCEFRK